MLPNMTNTVLFFSQNAIKRVKSVSTINFIETVVETDTPITGTIQTTEESVLIAQNLDFNKNYITVHTPTEIFIGHFVEYKSTEYRVVRRKDHSAYGFNRVIAEEVK